MAEGVLAKELGISRTPVREAMRLLLQEELLETGPRRQLFVHTISPERRREIVLLRESLERLAVEEACREMPIEEMDFLRLTIIRQRRMARPETLQEFMDLDEEFHTTIALGARLPTLVKFLGQLQAWVRLLGAPAATLPGRQAEVLVEHERIADALEARDAKAAVEAVIDHLRHSAAAAEATKAGQGVAKPGRGGGSEEPVA
jgi:DNA-binding GntR family transcriptional regulator